MAWSDQADLIQGKLMTTIASPSGYSGGEANLKSIFPFMTVEMLISKEELASLTKWRCVTSPQSVRNELGAVFPVNDDGF